MPSPPARSQSWPPTIRSALLIPRSPTASMSDPPPVHKLGSLEDEINESPDTHFLTPIEMFDWDDSDDSDAEEVEWNAGIQDFALFTKDRRAASERDEHVPTKWQSLIDSQASALQRAVERNRSSSEPSSHRTWTPLLEDVPALTPDNSPDLREHFDIDSYCHKRARRTSPPDCRRKGVSPHQQPISNLEGGLCDDDDDDDDICDVDLSMAALRKLNRERRLWHRRLERPGLRSMRTLSGKIHAWRRPRLGSVGEDPEAEAAKDDREA